MAINFKQQVTAEYFAEAIKKSAVTLGTNAPIITSAVITYADPAVVVTFNAGDATSAGSAVVAFYGQRAPVTTTDPGFMALPGFGSVQQPIYTTGVAVVLTELGAGGDLIPCGYPTLNAIFADLARRGLRIEHFATANATAPNTIDMSTFGITSGVPTLTGATRQATFEPNASWALSDRV